MAITIILPNALRPYADLRAQLPSDITSPPPGAAIYRNGTDLRRLQGLETPLRDDDRLTIIVPAGDL
jgi:sulfur-carrier protein